MRLIDADKLLELFDVEERYGYITADEVIQQQTIDPIKHAKWIEIKSSDFRDNDSFFKCSLCGRTERHKEPYCNCGAKMDKED